MSSTWKELTVPKSETGERKNAPLSKDNWPLFKGLRIEKKKSKKMK